LPCRLTSLITQLVTSHIVLNAHLHCISKSPSPICTWCNLQAPKTVNHLLLRCLTHQPQCIALARKCKHPGKAMTLNTILSCPEQLVALTTFINKTRWLCKTLGIIPLWTLPTDNNHT
ncbi:hypothetical protein BDQ12DRAFT_619610, partial [Crucibulum laeve]